MGTQSETTIIYGVSSSDLEALRDSVILECQNYGVRELARASEISVGEVSSVRRGVHKPSQDTLYKLIKSIEPLRSERREFEDRGRTVIEFVKQCCQEMSVRQFAKFADLDNGNLTKVLSGTRKPTTDMLSKLELALAKIRRTTYRGNCRAID